MSALSSGPRRPGIVLWLAFIILAARSVYSAPVHESDSTQVAEYDGGSSTGCYYNFQRYEEGDRIITNEPCLNCTCHNRMLMCYLRVCPFSKAIGQDCKVEKRPDQCCPIITCPQVPVQLLTSTTSSPSSNGLIAGDNSSSTELGFADTYGCSVDGRFYADGAQLPLNYDKPCDLCYCIRNRTTCLMQQCTLNVAGCKPVLQPGICCPVKYNCDYEDEYQTTPGLISTTTLAPSKTPPQCFYQDRAYANGELIKTLEPCNNCYCLHGKIMCSVDKCEMPVELQSKNCTAMPPLAGDCCPSTYNCDDGFKFTITEIPESKDDKDTTQQTPEKESFPGADNAIPEEIHIPTTEKLQTVSSLGNEIPESAPTKSTVAETMVTQESYTTLEPEVDKSTKPIEEQPEVKLADSHEESPSTETLDEQFVTSTEKELSEESEVRVTTAKSSSEVSSITDENIPEVTTVNESQDSNVIYDTITESVTEHLETSTEQNLTNAITTEKSIQPDTPLLESSPIPEGTSTPLPKEEKEITDKEKVTEIPSELSSLSSEVTSEQSISKEEVTEATLSTASTEVEKQDVTVQNVDITTESDKQIDESVTSKDIFNKEEVNNIITTVSSDDAVTSVPTDSKQADETETSVNTESEGETSTIYVRHEEIGETTTSINIESSTKTLIEDENSTSDKNEIPDNVNVVTSENSLISTSEDSITTESSFEKTTKTSSMIDQEKESSHLPSSTDSSLEDLSSTISPEDFSEKPKYDETSKSTPEMEHPVESADDKLDVLEKESTDIPIPDRVPEHKAEDKDAVADSEVTEGYITGSGMPHQIDNLHTDYPESAPTTYLPPLGSSTESERQPSTPLYEDLPKEELNTEEPITELSITPKVSSEKPIVNDEILGNEIPLEKKEPMESNVDLLTDEKKNEELSTEVNTSLPEEYTTKTSYPNNEKVESETTQKPSDDLLPTLQEESTDKIESEDKSVTTTSPAESTSTSIQKEDDSEPMVDEDKSKTELHDESKPSETTKETVTDSPYIENATSESTSDSIATEKATSELEPTDALKPSTEELPVEPKIEMHTEEEMSSENVNVEKSVTIQPDGITESFETTESSSESIENKTVFDEVTEKSTETPIEPKLTSTTSSTEILETTPLGTVQESDMIKPIEEKTEFDSELANAIPTSSVKPKEESTDQPIQSVSTLESSTEQTQSTEDASKKEEESSHTTEFSVIPDKTISTHEMRPSSGIPGEGNCLVNGQTYKNNSAIPPTKACHLSCLCVSSIVECTFMQCPPPPTNVTNCVSVQKGPETCCPIYMCDSMPSVELEADNQKSDQHTASEEIQTTQKNSIEESTQAIEVTPVTEKADAEKPSEVSTKLQSDSTESTSEKIESETAGTPVSPVARETESPIKIKDTATTEESEVTSASYESFTTVETNEVTREATSEITESNLHTSTENIKDLLDKTVTDSSSTSELENKESAPLTTESGESTSTGKSNIDNLTSTETLSTEQEISKFDQSEETTISSKSTEADTKETSSETSTSQIDDAEKPTDNDIPAIVTQISVDVEKSTEEPTSVTKLTLPEESEISSTNIPESASLPSEENVIRNETPNAGDSNVEINTTLSPESSSETQSITKLPTIPEKETTEIISSHDNELPEEIQPEHSTEISDNQTPEPVEATEKINQVQESATEKSVELEVTTIQESSIGSSSADENVKVTVLTDKPEQESSSMPSFSEPAQEITSASPKEEPITETFVTVESDSSTQSTTIESVSEKEQISESSSASPTEKSESLDELNTEETPVKEKQPQEVTEAVEVISENITEKPAEEPIKPTEDIKETSDEILTQSQENAESVTGETKIEMTEQPELEKETPAPNAEEMIEHSIDTKISPETESSVTSDDQKNITYPSSTESVESGESVSSTPTPLSAEKETESSLQVSSETTPKIDEELLTKDQENKEDVSESTITESTKIESSTSKDPIKNITADDEFTSLDSGSEEASAEVSTESKEDTSSSTETIISSSPLSNDVTSEKSDEEKPSTSSTVSEMSPADSEILKEQHTTLPHDVSTSTETPEVANEDEHVDSQQTEVPVYSTSSTTSQGQSEPITTSPPLTRPKFPDEQVSVTEDQNYFPPNKAGISTDESEYTDEEDENLYGHGTCRYGGKIYMSAQQIPRDDPCDFCFCFRSDIICLQQSCPPPIAGCNEEPIGGFCCPRYECPVSMAVSLNLTTTTTTTTTTLPPIFPTHAYKGQAVVGGCQIDNKSYKVGENIRSISNSCTSCKCGGDGKMECDPKLCTASPTLKGIIAAAAEGKRRRRRR